METQISKALEAERARKRENHDLSESISVGPPAVSSRVPIRSGLSNGQVIFLDRLSYELERRVHEMDSVHIRDRPPEFFISSSFLVLTLSAIGLQTQATNHVDQVQIAQVAGLPASRSIEAVPYSFTVKQLRLALDNPPLAVELLARNWSKLRDFLGLDKPFTQYGDHFYEWNIADPHVIEVLEIFKNTTDTSLELVPRADISIKPNEQGDPIKQVLIDALTPSAPKPQEIINLENALLELTERMPSDKQQFADAVAKVLERNAYCVRILPEGTIARRMYVNHAGSLGFQCTDGTNPGLARRTDSGKLEARQFEVVPYTRRSLKKSPSSPTI